MEADPLRSDHCLAGRCPAWLLPFLVLTAEPALPAVQGPGATGDAITVAVLEDRPPYYLTDGQRRPAGFAVDLFNAVAARAGLVPRYRKFPSFAAMQKALRTGEVDVIPNFGILPEREFLFTSPVSTFQVSAFVRKSSPGLRTLQDVRGTIAVVETNVGERLVGCLADAHTVIFQSVREALFRLVAGEVDAVVFPSLIEVKRAMAVALDREDLQARLDRAVRSFIGTAEYEAIYRRWYLALRDFWTIRPVSSHHEGAVHVRVRGVCPRQPGSPGGEHALPQQAVRHRHAEPERSGRARRGVKTRARSLP